MQPIDLQQLNVRISPNTHEALRRVAFERRLSLRDLVAGIIQEWLATEADHVVARWSSELERTKGPKEAA